MQETVFAELDAAEKPQIDLSVLERMLQPDKDSAKGKTRPSVKAARGSIRGDEAAANRGVMFLDQKKAQNIAIALRRVCTSKGGTAELAERLRVLDLDNPLPAENCDILINAIPEVLGCGLEQYAGSVDRLSTIDRELLNLVRVPRLIPRLNMMQLISQLDETQEAATNDISTLARASAQVKNSALFRRVLQMALHIGNYVNTGAENLEVRGITIDSIVKMHSYKNGELSALHLVTQELMKKDPQFAQSLRSELTDVQAMTPGSLQNLRDQIGRLEQREHDVCNELEYKDAYEVDGDRRAVFALTRLAERTSETVRDVRRQYNEAIEEARACAVFFAAGINSHEDVMPDTKIEEFFKTVQEIANLLQVCSADLDNRAASSVRNAGRMAAGSAAAAAAQRRDSASDPQSEGADKTASSRPRIGGRQIIRDEKSCQAANDKVAVLLRARAAACDPDRECS